MNKAFVREPEDTGKAFCPRCGMLGVAVGAGPLDMHVQESSRAGMRDSAWFCPFGQCDVAYFNQWDAVIAVSELKSPVYPKDLDAPMCACFGFTYDDVAADVREGKPTRIRELLAKSRSPEAHCKLLAADGRCCISAVTELYTKLQQARQP
jgi:hypothetical protein